MKHKKLRDVLFNNRKKQLSVSYQSGKKVTVHYSQLGIDQNIEKAWVCAETKNQSIGFKLQNGRTDYMPYDQPLALSYDPDYLLQTAVEEMIAKIKLTIEKKGISKKYLAEQLHTSDNQVQRLLNPKILNKNLSQLYHISTLLGLNLEIHLKEAA